MTTRKLASFTVSSVGMGSMGFSHGYGALPPEELAAIESELAKITIHGNRTDEDIQRMGYVKAQ